MRRDSGAFVGDCPNLRVRIVGVDGSHYAFVSLANSNFGRSIYVEHEVLDPI